MLNVSFRRSEIIWTFNIFSIFIKIELYQEERRSSLDDILKQQTRDPNLKLTVGEEIVILTTAYF